MLVLHPDGATVLLKHIEDENGTLRCNSVFVLVEKPDCKKKYYLFFFFFLILFLLTKSWMEWMMRKDG
jgi:hypothetical protein